MCMYMSRTHVDWLVNIFGGKIFRLLCGCCYVLSKNKIIDGSMFSFIHTVVKRFKAETSSFFLFSIQIRLYMKIRTILQYIKSLQSVCYVYMSAIQNWTMM